ncbi:MAG: NarK/NasA family nitrate transporter [Actinobacteria bacterium]|nr:NarK/NasA family nitrate transporter [Actinomycetota bacterium]
MTDATATLDGPPHDAAGVAAPPRPAPSSAAAQSRRGRWIDDWRPEDEAFWASTGARVAKRNLVFSILSEHIGFSVWTMWSALVLFLGKDYGFTPAQKFLLTSTPALVGSVLRIPYTFAVARFGGRTWTVISGAALLVPCLAALVVLRPGVSLGTLLVVAALAGVGGGNFASSMANINAFYPERLKGWALGMNAGGGNLGVAAVQLVALAVLATAGSGAPRLLIGIYLPLIVVALVCAAVKMDNLTAVRNERRAMRDAIREPHAWVVALLYIGTFGSFIGLSFAFGQVLLTEFASRFDTPTKAASITFLGPLLGSLIRPVGGRLADRFGGARVTLITFLAMSAGGVVIVAASSAHSLPLYLVGFVTLFALTGVGNGSTYKMIPAIFLAKARRSVVVDGSSAADGQAAAALGEARRLSSGLIGVVGAIGSFGGVLVNLALRQSFLSAQTGRSAYVAFLAYYVVCAVLTWAVYLRRSATRLIP